MMNNKYHFKQTNKQASKKQYDDLIYVSQTKQRRFILSASRRFCY